MKKRLYLSLAYLRMGEYKWAFHALYKPLVFGLLRADTYTKGEYL